MRLNYIYILLIAGMPGLQRLLIFIISSYVVDMGVIGRFSNDLNIIQFISFFTAIGWGGLLLIRIPKLKNDLVLPFLNDTVYNMLTYTIFGFLILSILFYYGLIYDLVASCLFLLGWSGYQILRHFYIAQRKYKELVIIDIILTIVLILSIFINMSDILLMNISWIYIGIFLFFILINNLFKIKTIRVKDHFIKSNEIGITNVLSSSVTMLMIPIFNFYLGEDYAALIGVTFAILSVLLLLPRAMSKYYLPLFSKYIDNKMQIIKLLDDFNRYNFIVLITIGVLSYFAMIFLAENNFKEIFLLDNSKVFFIYILLFTIVGQFSLPVSNVILALEKTRFLMIINLMYIVFIFIAFGLDLFLYEKVYDILLFLLRVIIFSEFLRYIALTIYIKKLIRF